MFVFVLHSLPPFYSKEVHEFNVIKISLFVSLLILLLVHSQMILLCLIIEMYFFLCWLKFLLLKFTQLGYSKEHIISAFTEVSRIHPNKDVSSLWPAVLCHLREQQIYGSQPESLSMLIIVPWLVHILLFLFPSQIFIMTLSKLSSLLIISQIIRVQRSHWRSEQSCALILRWTCDKHLFSWYSSLPLESLLFICMVWSIY